MRAGIGHSIGGVLVTVLSIAASALPGSAQSAERGLLHVQVVENGSGRVVEGASVVLERLARPDTGVQAADDRPTREGVTNNMGRVSLSGLPWGRYVVTVRGLGFEDRSDTIGVNARVADVSVELSRKPIQLDPIVVVSRSEKLSEVGYYDRQQGGLSGHYLTQADVDRYRPRGLTDLFYRIPGTKVTYSGPGQRVLRFRRWPNAVSVDPNGCVPDIYLDGALVGPIAGTHNIYTARLPDYDVIPPSEVEGIEVYVGAATPIQFRNSCGVVLIWTRR